VKLGLRLIRGLGAIALVLCTLVLGAVPVVVTMVLPFRSLMPVMPELALTAMRTSSTYVVTAKATSLARVALLVVEPHSRSTVPFCTSGTRFCEVTGWYLVSSFLPTTFSRSLMMLAQTS
jgi:hypothetical protein